MMYSEKPEALDEPSEDDWNGAERCHTYAKEFVDQVKQVYGHKLCEDQLLISLLRKMKANRLNRRFGNIDAPQT